MAELVIDPHEVSINAVRYKLVGDVQRALSSNYPEKTVIGDYTKDSSPILSTLALSDHRRGIGLDIMTGDGDTDRSWYSTADTRYKGHLILPPLVTNTGSLPTGLTQIYQLMVHKGAIYANVDATTNGIVLYTSGTDSWGANILGTTMADVSGRWTSAELGGKFYILFGASGGKYYHFDGTTWAERTATNRSGFMAFWDGRVWGISNRDDCSLWYTYTPGSAEVGLGITPAIRSTLPNAGQLFVARDASGEKILYLAIPTGLWAYDVDNDAWLPTSLQVPDNAGVVSTNFASAVEWRDDIYFATRSSVFKYSMSSSGAIISLIGPDQDFGLPSTKGFIISDMVASLNDIIISLVGTGKTSLIMAWNGQGWRVLYEGGSGLGEQLSNLLVAGLAGNYRLWFGNNTTSPFNISWLSLPSDIVNPLQIPTYTYAAAATHDWPYFTAGQSDVNKIAVRVKVETVNPTTSETVKVYYAINRSSTFQLMTNSTFTTGIITTAGLHTFDLPCVDTYASTTARTGVAFRSIQFRVVSARGGTTTNTPDVLSLTLEYYKKLDPKYQFIVNLDLNHDYKGNTPKAQRAALLTAQETGPLVEFTYRDPPSNSDATFYVQVRPQVSTEETGYSEKGQSQLLLVEV